MSSLPDVDQIRELLPYRAPMLLVEGVVSWSQDEIVVTKTVAADDPIIAGHLVGGPRVMPGVLLIELVGQAAVLHRHLLAGGDDGATGPTGLQMLGRCKARFLKPAFAGETVTAAVTSVGRAMGGAIHSGRLFVDDELIAEIEVVSARAP